MAAAFPMAPKLQFPERPLFGLRLERQLLSWTAENAVVVPKRKITLLPVLVVLFLVSYGLLAVLVVEQGRTIDNQRSLIMSLFQDSNKLTQLEGKTFQKQRAEAQAQAAAKDHNQVQTPSTQATPQGKSKDSHNGTKLRRTLPKPPVGADDNGDTRRTVLKI